MKMENEFRVSAPLEEAWAVLTDIPTIAPCMPGATLTSVEDDAYTGKVKIKGVVLSAGTGTYVIRLANPATVTAKWSVKLPKIKGTVLE